MNSEINTKKFSGYLLDIEFGNEAKGILTLKSNDINQSFSLSNMKFDFLMMSHLNQHMLLGEQINITAYKKDGVWEIIKIYDLDGTIHVDQFK
jgi:hypothetical protein